MEIAKEVTGRMELEGKRQSSRSLFRGEEGFPGGIYTNNLMLLPFTSSAVPSVFPLLLVVSFFGPMNEKEGKASLVFTEVVSAFCAVLVALFFLTFLLSSSSSPSI